MGVTIGVLGGSGGVGASTFAAVLAWVAGAVLVDLDAAGGGIDVLLGVEAVAGARWSGVRLDGGRIDPDRLRDGLPHWSGVPVLACDSSPPSCSDASEVLGSARELGTVVLDLGRSVEPRHVDVLEQCALVVVVARASVRALAAARAVTARASALSGAAPIVALLRPGAVATADAADLLGLPVVGALPGLAFGADLSRGRPPRSLRRCAAGVLDGVGGRMDRLALRRATPVGGASR